MIDDLNKCDTACFGCIKQYKTKHKLVAGQKFRIGCSGIPKFEQMELVADLPAEIKESAISVLDPVAWAANTLDWHCLDPDGEVWKRKNPLEYANWMKEHPGEDIYGKSRYHRPYQATMLRCTSKRKVFRLGRQCGKSEAMVISMLFHLFTKPNVPENEGFKIVILTPYQAQIDLLFKRMEELLGSSSVTSNCIQRNVKAPIYTITLNNKSEVRGFTAGTKSGGNADAIRGQHANMLVFDEADYLASKDMESALSIITNHPDASVWMSSTPQGKREQFYTKCLANDWKEFYYPSQANPLFDATTDKLFRDTMSEIAYKHEVLAEFGEQEEGVFQNAYIQAAKADYRYSNMSRQRHWTYTIGVDWNDTKNGTTIVVLGLDVMHNLFYVVDRKTVSRDGWTQLAACQQIADYNRIWQPVAIYVDAGYGATQFEVLRKFSYDALADPSRGAGHPDAKLKNVLKRYDFGSNIEVHDLWTHAPVKKSSKPFLVESTARRFETNDIRFSKFDETLEKQLQGYIVDHVTQTGTPVYVAGNEVVGDHVLDALMLAVVAFVLEKTPLGKPVYQSNIAFSGQFGEKRQIELFPGDTVITNNQKDKESDRDRIRPSMTRVGGVQRTSLLGLTAEMPANHVDHGQQLALWDYPGFMKDAPKPRVLTLAETELAAKKRLGLWGPRSINKPRRKNI